MFIKKPISAIEWCDFYGVEVNDGVAILYKGVNDDFRSPSGFLYQPGTTPEAADWDGGAEECGGGLHFSPRPSMTLEFHTSAKRFVACPVALEDMAFHLNAIYPQKIKARRICRPCYECDKDGNRIGE